VHEAVSVFQRLGVNRDSRVIVYDQGGGAYAARAWWMLRWLGHAAVLVLDGGWSDWSRQGFPAEAGSSTPVPGNFRASVAPGMVVATDELPSLVNRGVPLFDARDKERFAGIREPIDAVAGHIPGARNLPFQQFLTDVGRIVEANEARKLWTDNAGLEPDTEWVAMCGSGVTACHLALTAELAGMRLPRLYAGSWSEWIRDPGRPVATGLDDQSPKAEGISGQ
jgi:thiosulfate/3-mercaptopyruvate sulfurtransferase